MDNQRRKEDGENFHIRPARVDNVPIILGTDSRFGYVGEARHEVTATKEQRLNLSCCCAKKKCLAQHCSQFSVNFHNATPVLLATPRTIAV